MDILRRNLAFSQNQAVGQKPPQQPQFGLGAQMDPSHSFNDPQPGQGFPPQLPAGFTSNAQLQQVLAARNQNMTLAPQARQLDLLMAQNQQNNQQSAAFNYASIRQFQQQSQPHSQPQMQQVHPGIGMPMQAGQMGQQGAFIGAGIQNAQHQVQNGVANVRAEGAAAPLLSQNLPDLRASLASSGLSLGGFESGDSPRREQPDNDGAESPTPAGKAIANAPRRSSKSRLEVEA